MLRNKVDCFGVGRREVGVGAALGSRSGPFWVQVQGQQTLSQDACTLHTSCGGSPRDSCPDERPWASLRARLCCSKLWWRISLRRKQGTGTSPGRPLPSPDLSAHLAESLFSGHLPASVFLLLICSLCLSHHASPSHSLSRPFVSTLCPSKHLSYRSPGHLTPYSKLFLWSPITV